MLCLAEIEWKPVLLKAGEQQGTHSGWRPCHPGLVDHGERFRLLCTMGSQLGISRQPNLHFQKIWMKNKEGKKDKRGSRRLVR